jgi:hypothetical protein
MSGDCEGDHDVAGMDGASRAELLEARTKLERQIDELSYTAIIGTILPSAKPDLIKRLKSILAEMDQKLAEMDR